MNDSLHELADRLDRELTALRWEDPRQIRRRGSRRRLRGATAAVVAVVVLVAGGWGLSARWPAQHPVAPQGDDISVSALLQPADLGRDYEIDNEQTEEPGEYLAWTFARDECSTYTALSIDSYQQYLFMRYHILARKGDNEGHSYVFAEVRRFPDNMGRQVMRDVTRMVSACPVYTTPTSELSTETRPVTGEMSWAVLDRDFAGEESLLIRQQADHVDAAGQVLRRGVELYAVVRVADLVAITNIPRDDPQRLRELATHTASRLCAATTTC